MLNWLSSLKGYALIFLAAISTILGALFLYERRKVVIDDAVIGEKKVDDDLAKADASIASNNELLKQQQQDRTNIENGKTNEEPTADDITKRLGQ